MVNNASLIGGGIHIDLKVTSCQTGFRLVVKKAQIQLGRTISVIRKVQDQLVIEGICSSIIEFEDLSIKIRSHQRSLIATNPGNGLSPLLFSYPAKNWIYHVDIGSFQAGGKRFEYAPIYTLNMQILSDLKTINLTPISHVITPQQVFELLSTQGDRAFGIKQ